MACSTPESHPGLRVRYGDLIVDYGQCLGRGGCGEVFRGNHRHWGPIAYKKLTTLINLQAPERLIREVEFLKDLRHQNIAELLGFVWEPQQCGLLLKYYQLGSLDVFMQRGYRFKEFNKMMFVQQIVLGMNYLHTRQSPIVHRDLKITNILVNDDCSLRISDFGISQWRATQTQLQRKSGISSKGTCTHIAPEKLQNINHKPNQAYDIYAFAILLWEVWTELVPYEGSGDSEIILAVRSGQRPDYEEFVQKCRFEVVKQILRDSWKQDPNQRPTFQDIKEKLDVLCSTHEEEIRESHSELMIQVYEPGSPCIGTPNSLRAFPAFHMRDDDPTPSLFPPNVSDDESSQSTDITSSDSLISAVLPRDDFPYAITYMTDHDPKSLSLPKSSKINVRKIRSHKFEADKPHFAFGQMNEFMYSCYGSQNLNYFKVASEGWKRQWMKPLPDKLKYNCRKYISSSGQIYLQRKRRVYVYDANLLLVRRIPINGRILGLVGESRMLVDDFYSKSPTLSLFMCSLESTTPNVLHKLETPAAVVYTKNDFMSTCCREDGRTAVVVGSKLDFYDAAGRFVHHQPLSMSMAASGLGCSAAHVLVPITRRAVIDVFTWDGVYQHTLGHDELEKPDAMWCCDISPVVDGVFHVLFQSPQNNCQVDSYEIIKDKVEKH